MGCSQSQAAAAAAVDEPVAHQPPRTSSPQSQSTYQLPSPSFVSELPKRRTSRSPVSHDDPALRSLYRALKTRGVPSVESIKKLPHMSSVQVLKRPAAVAKYRDVMSIFGEKGYFIESSNVASDVNTPTSSIGSATLPMTPTCLGHIHDTSLSITYGAASISGRRAINEDRVACIVHGETSDVSIGFFAVYDGHGGANVSDYLSTNLHHHVFEHLDAHPTDSLDTALKSSMVATDNIIYDQAIHHGSTAIAMVLDGTTMAFASLGDSQAILSSNQGRDVVDLCRSHRPTDAAERDRILAAKGTVVDGRIFGLLGVSRAFGDNDLKTSKGAFKDKFNGDIVGGQPDVRLHRLRPEDDFVVLACDGIFDVLSPEALVNFVNQRLTSSPDVQAICDEVVAHAMRLGSTDNLSVVIVRFHQL
ncbi:hypothetical protein AC1031_013568 [Aphanomyces cochlioides]|nr:hypothetical protein AC1031_013568 [Aphanomyces cochlioides]